MYSAWRGLIAEKPYGIIRDSPKQFVRAAPVLPKGLVRTFAEIQTEIEQTLAELQREGCEDRRALLQRVALLLVQADEVTDVKPTKESPPPGLTEAQLTAVKTLVEIGLTEERPDTPQAPAPRKKAARAGG